MIYRLIRENDQMNLTGREIKWFIFGSKIKAYETIRLNSCLVLDPQLFSYTWMTTPITEIIEEKEDYVKFKTKNSVYELFTYKN
jgi:hypothetical protein